MRIRIGTRGSRLALVQAEMVTKALKRIDNKIEVEIVVIKTKGDLILDISLDKIGDKGLFVGEIEQQLRLGTIDMAVHSLKDLPSEESTEFQIIPVLKRDDPRDVLITRYPVSIISHLPDKMTVGTGSKRRSVQIKRLLSDVKVVPIRGNVETRIQKMIQQPMDGTILAAAGINRLEIEQTDAYTILPFSIEQMIPAPAQGIIACQILKNSYLEYLVRQLVDEETWLAALAERGYMHALQGGCHMPLGGYLEKQGQVMKFHYLYGNENCEKIVKGIIDINGDVVDEEGVERLMSTIESLANHLVEEIGK